MDRAVLEPEGRANRSSAEETVSQATVRYATEWADPQGDDESASIDGEPGQDLQAPAPEAQTAAELEYWFG